MKHLRDSGIDINGSSQKRRLKNIGYYHGYKGYRFAGTASNRLPLTDFSQMAALYDFDTQLKTLFYSRVMAIETALKNYTLEAVLRDARSEAFEDIGGLASRTIAAVQVGPTARHGRGVRGFAARSMASSSTTASVP